MMAHGKMPKTVGKRMRRYLPKPTKVQLKERKRLQRNQSNRRSYNRKQRRAFYEEYARICKKYGCRLGLHYPTVWKVKRGEKISTIKSQLESV